MFSPNNVFWISSSNTSRHAYMKSQFQKYNIENTHVEALSTNSSNLTILDSFPPLRDNRAGCLASHLKAVNLSIEYMRKNHRNYTIIMEDDVYIEEGLKIHRVSIDTLISKLPIDWEILQLGYHSYRSAWSRLQLQWNMSRSLFMQKQMFPAWATFAFALSLSGARRMHRNYRIYGDRIEVTRKCSFDADACIMSGQIVQKWKNYIATPPYFWEPTTITSTKFHSTLGSNSYLHAYSSKISARWANNYKN